MNAPNDLMLYVAVTIAGGLLIAVFSFGMALFYTRRARAVRSWSTAPGKILASELRLHSTNRRGRRFIPIIRYEYDVGGRVYQSDTLSREVIRSMTEYEARAKLDTYPVGAWMDVYYDPSRPEQSVLEVVKPQVWWMLVLGGSMLCLSVTAAALYLALGRG